MFNPVSGSDLLKSKKAAGVHIELGPGETMTVNYIILRRRRNKIISDSFGSLEGLNGLEEKVQVSIPIFVSVDGKGIVHKVVISRNGEDYISKVFPDADPNEFQFEATGIGQSKEFVSVMRKEKIDKILSLLEELHFYVFGISIGPSPAFQLIQANKTKESFRIPGYRLSLKNNEITDVIKDSEPLPEEEFTFENTQVSYKYFLALSCCLKHFKKNNTGDYNSLLFKEQSEKYYYKRLFQISSQVILAFFFTLLLINFLVFNRIRNKNQLLREEIVRNEVLLKSIKEKESRLRAEESTLWDGRVIFNNLFAYYSDRIASITPSQITLERMELAPQAKRTSNPDQFQFAGNKVVISGFTAGSGPLNVWIKKLKDLPWVSEVFINSYNSGAIDGPKFEIEITLKN